MVVKKKATSSAKAKATSSKTKTKTKAKAAQQDIFLYISKNDRYEDGGNLPFMRGFVSIPANLVDTIQEMGFYDEERDSYQLDVSLWKKGGGVLSGTIKKSWKVDKDEEDDDLDLDDEDEDDDDKDDDSDDDDDTDEEDELDEGDEGDEEDDEPAPVQTRKSSAKPRATLVAASKRKVR